MLIETQTSTCCMYCRWCCCLRYLRQRAPFAAYFVIVNKYISVCYRTTKFGEINCFVDQILARLFFTARLLLLVCKCQKFRS